MNETVRLWSQDYSEILFTTEDREAAKQFLMSSGHDWLPVVIDYGTDWRQRWSGRLALSDGEVSFHHDSKYLRYLMHWPTNTGYRTDCGHDSECEHRKYFTIHDGIKYCDGCGGALCTDGLLYDSDYDDLDYEPSWAPRLT